MTSRKRSNERPGNPATEPTPPGDRLRPWLLMGMTALFVARPLFPSESAASYGDGLAMVMLWIALATFWFLGVLGRPSFAIRFGATDLAAWLLVGWYVVASLWAVQHGTPRPALNMLWEWVGIGVCFLMARQLILTAQESRAVVAVMIAVAVALAAYGLYQRFYELPSTHAEYLADPDGAMRSAGLWFPPDSPERALFEARLENREPLATFALTNSLAAFLAPWFIMLAAVGVSLRHDRRRLLATLFCLAPIAICLVFTKSRSGFVAAGVGLGLIWFFSNSRANRIGWKVSSAIAAVVVIVAALIATGHDRGLLEKASRSFGYRVQYWQSTARMIADHPVVGCGPGNFQNVYPQYKLPEASEEIADPHNFLFDIWANAGTPAALAFLAVLGCFAWRQVAGQRRGAGPLFGEKTSSAENRLAENRDMPPSRRGGVESQATDSFPRHVFAGGAIGFLISVPIGLLSAAPPGLFVVLLGGPLAIAAVWLMRGWVCDGQLPRFAPAVGVVVLLIDLLAAGGIGLPSVAGTLWLLLALGLRGDAARSLRPAFAWLALGVAVFLAVACYLTAYGPVLSCQGQMRLALRRPSQAVACLEAAAAADPLNAEPWHQLAAVAFEQWQQQPTRENFERFRRACAKFLELSPNAAPAWWNVGDWHYRAASQATADPKFAADALGESVRAFGKAVELYPNSALYRAWLAEAHFAAGDASQFRREADAALRLDEITPHRDKKLPAELRARLVRHLDGKPK